MAIRDRSGETAGDGEELSAIGALQELGAACRELKTAERNARDREQDLVGISLTWMSREARPREELVELYARLGDEQANSLEEAYAGWVAWYAAAATELLISQAGGQPLLLDAIYRWRDLSRGGHDTCPGLPEDEQIRLGIEQRDKEVAAALALVRSSRDADAWAEEFGAMLDKLRQRRDVPKRCAFIADCICGWEVEAMDLPERLYDYGRLAEAALIESLLGVKPTG